MRTWVAVAGAVLAGMLSAASASAAAPDPFAGVWVLDAGKSRSVNVALPRSEERVYGTNVEGALTIIVEGEEADGTPFAFGATGDLNGRSYPVAGRDVGARTLGDTISWTQVDPRTVEMTVLKKGEIINRTRHSLSADGRELTVTETLVDERGQKSESVKVFNRR